MHAAPDDLQALEVLQALGKRGGIRAHGSAQLVEAERTVQKSSDDVQRPFLLQELYGGVNRAELMVVGHTPT